MILPSILGVTMEYYDPLWDLVSTNMYDGMTEGFWTLLKCFGMGMIVFSQSYYHFQSLGICSDSMVVIIVNVICIIAIMILYYSIHGITTYYHISSYITRYKILSYLYIYICSDVMWCDVIWCSIIHIHSFSCMCIHIYVYTYIHTYIHTSIHTYIHTSIHTYIHPYIHPYIHTSIHTSIHAYIHTYIHTYIYIYLSYLVHISTYSCSRSAELHSSRSEAMGAMVHHGSHGIDMGSTWLITKNLQGWFLCLG